MFLFLPKVIDDHHFHSLSLLLLRCATVLEIINYLTYIQCIAVHSLPKPLLYAMQEAGYPNPSMCCFLPMLLLCCLAAALLLSLWNGLSDSLTVPMYPDESQSLLCTRFTCESCFSSCWRRDVGGGWYSEQQPENCSEFWCASDERQEETTLRFVIHCRRFRMR